MHTSTTDLPRKGMTHVIRNLVIEDILAVLYQALEQQVKGQIEQMIQRNNTLYHREYRGFTFQGEHYLLATQSRGKVMTLHPELEASFLELKQQWWQDFGQERSHVDGYLRRATSACTYEDELFWVIPETLHSKLAQILGYDKPAVPTDFNPENPFNFQTQLAVLRKGYPNIFERMAQRRVTNILLGYSEDRGD